MAKYAVKIEIEADSVEKVKTVGCALQNAVNSVNNDELVRLVNAAVKNPNLVKTALKFL